MLLIDPGGDGDNERVVEENISKRGGARRKRRDRLVEALHAEVNAPQRADDGQSDEGDDLHPDVVIQVQIPEGDRNQHDGHVPDGDDVAVPEHRVVVRVVVVLQTLESRLRIELERARIPRVQQGLVQRLAALDDRGDVLGDQAQDKEGEDDDVRLVRQEALREVRELDAALEKLVSWDLGHRLREEAAALRRDDAEKHHERGGHDEPALLVSQREDGEARAGDVVDQQHVASQRGDGLAAQVSTGLEDRALSGDPRRRGGRALASR
mmetsp:Transcript_28627/g.53652  ORF Transcript_28627/g.53652 Transcript_28627/m.53652 type:complete len:267 (-) Transcript_28627:42-842(-)